MGMIAIAVLVVGGFALLIVMCGANHDVVKRKERERYALVSVKTGPVYHWRRTPFLSIKKGQIFMLFESTGDPVPNYKGGFICKAESDATEYGIIAEAM